jgi:hypothetical protein
MRRTLIAVVASLGLALPLAGCGRSNHRVFNGAVCAFSVWRASHDARTHHFGFAAFQAYLALHHCPRAFGFHH